MWLTILVGVATSIAVLVWLFLIRPKEETDGVILALASELEEELEGYPYLILTRGNLILVYKAPTWELVEVIHSEEELFAFLAKEKHVGEDTKIPE